MGAALGEHVQNIRVSEEDAGRHCGRRGHLPSVSLEDANPLIEIYLNFLLGIMILCLPSENASGAHVFLCVFQRLPQKHWRFP